MELNFTTHCDPGDECGCSPVAPLPATITTMKGTKIYPPVNDSLYIIKRGHFPAHSAWDLAGARIIADRLERMAPNAN